MKVKEQTKDLSKKRKRESKDTTEDDGPDADKDVEELSLFPSVS